MIVVDADGCTPPPGTTPGTFHWLRHPETGDVACLRWVAEGDRWRGLDFYHRADNLEDDGWRYWCPAGPPDPAP